MTEVTKVSDERLAELRRMQQEFDVLLKRLGELVFQKKLVNRELETVDKALDSLEVLRIQTVTALQEEFGSTGTINLSTGEFVSD